MSKKYPKCPKCESIRIVKAPSGDVSICLACESVFNTIEGKSKQTLFDHVTSSPEAMAAKLVYYLPGVGWYFSTLFDGDTCWKTKPEALAATVAKLREVENA